MIVNTDIDIDVADRDQLLKLIKHTPAMILDNGKQKKHNTGVYFHKMPENPFTGFSTIDYGSAEQLGYFKLDILNVSIYNEIKSNEQLDRLLTIEPMWELLDHKEIVDQLFHIHGHYDVVSKMNPRSIEQLAAVLAMIRPAKRYLVGRPWDNVLSEVWKRPDDGSYYFKKSHSISYALAIVVQMNMLVIDFYSQD
jgi:hypothetical protein